MSTEQKVVVIIEASQGIGADLVEGFVKVGYCVAASSRAIKPSASPHSPTVTVDIADPGTADYIVGAAIAKFGCIDGSDTLADSADVFRSKPQLDKRRKSGL